MQQSLPCHDFLFHSFNTGSAPVQPTKFEMKIQNLIGSLLALGLFAGLLTGCATEEQKEAKLQAEAKISRADAERTALAKVPGGSVKEGELEKEKGKLIWSFDIATAGTKDVTEVQVDAITGEVVSVEHESAAHEAKEKEEKK
jgi:hypothetical protein